MKKRDSIVSKYLNEILHGKCNEDLKKDLKKD